MEGAAGSKKSKRKGKGKQIEPAPQPASERAPQPASEPAPQPAPQPATELSAGSSAPAQHSLGELPPSTDNEDAPEKATSLILDELPAAVANEGVVDEDVVMAEHTPDPNWSDVDSDERLSLGPDMPPAPPTARAKRPRSSSGVVAQSAASAARPLKKAKPGEGSSRKIKPATSGEFLKGQKLSKTVVRASALPFSRGIS